MSKIGDIDQKLHVLSSSSMDDHYHRRITIIWRERLFEAEPSRAISRFTRKSPNRSKLRPTLRICAPVYFVFVFQFLSAFWLIWGAKYSDMKFVKLFTLAEFWKKITQKSINQHFQLLWQKCVNRHFRHIFKRFMFLSIYIG